MIDKESLESYAKDARSQKPNEGNVDLFAPGAAAYVRRAYPIWLLRHWWLLILPGGLAIAAVWWPVCIFVALMVGLLLYPSILLMVYLSYATSRRAVQWTYPRRVAMDDDGFRIRYEAVDSGHAPKDCRIQWSNVRHVAFSGLLVTAYLSSGPYDIIPLGWPMDNNRAEWLKGHLAALGIEFA